MNALTEFRSSLLDLRDLPTLPESLIELIDACDDDEIDIHDIGELVARDPSLSARILQLANSAFLGTRSTFSTIQQAVIYLGIDTIRNLAISTSAYEVFHTSRVGDAIGIDQFWYHCFFTASLAKLLAEETGYPNPAEAYLTGLLHDIGKLLLAVKAAEQYADLLADAPERGDVAAREQDRFGICHAEAGALLLRHWRLPEKISAAIEGHHKLEPSGPTDRLGELLYLANNVGAIDFSNSGSFPGAESISGEDYEKCLETAADTVESVASALGISIKAGRLSSKTSQSEDLHHRIAPLTLLYGCLDNLLKARDLDRICQVVEESLQILFSVEKSMIVLAPKGEVNCEILASKTNPLNDKLAAEISPITGTLLNSPPLNDCFKRAKLASATIPEATRNSHEAQLFEIFAEENLLAVPVETGDKIRGALLLGLSPDKAKELLSDSASLLSLAAHAGARLQLGYMIATQAREIAERELQAVDTVARSVAHEITNPLGIVQNSLALLYTKLGDTTAADIQVGRDLRLLQSEIERIAAVTRQLNDIRQIKHFNSSDKTESVGSLITDVVSLFSQSLFDQLGIEVSASLAPNTGKIEVPGEMLRQVLGILFHNCADAMPGGGKIILESQITAIGGIPGPRNLLLTVTDDGPGVDASVADSLFNAGVSTKEEGHLGLGLSIARKQIVDHGGEIRLEFPEEDGCRFLLQLPIH